MRRAWGTIAVLLAVALVSGCSSQAAPPAYQPVPHKPVTMPGDRDEAAALASLRWLDLCRLLDAPAGGHAEYEKSHWCRLRTNLDGINSPRIDAMLSERTSHFAKAKGARVVTIAGAKAYEPLPDTESCRIEVPVTFQYAVAFTASVPSGDLGGSDLCPLAHTAAEHGVRRLAGAVTLPGSVPYAIWDPCSVLSAAVEGQNLPVRVTPHQQDTFIGCDADSTAPSDPAAMRLRLSVYGSLTQGHDEGTHKSLAGADVYLKPDKGRCTATWVAGPLPDDHGQTEVEVAATTSPDADCPLTEGLIAAVVTALGKAPPKADGKPRTYRPDEPDWPVAGACADYPEATAANCVPSQPVPLPHGTQSTVSGLQADPHVACAVGLAAVRKHFGAQFQAVADTTPNPGPGQPTGCRFVAADHRLELGLTAKPAAPLTGGAVIAGRPTSQYGDLPAERTLVLDTGAGQDGDRTWQLVLKVQFASGYQGAKEYAPGKAALLAPTMTDIATGFLDH